MKLKKSLNTKLLSIAIISISSLLTSCGGGGESNADGSINGSGVIQDGNIANSTVFLDTNNDGKFTTGEPTTLTDKDGKYTLNITAAQSRLNVAVIAQGGCDTTKDTCYKADGTFDTTKSKDTISYKAPNTFADGKDVVITPTTKKLADKIVPTVGTIESIPADFDTVLASKKNEIVTEDPTIIDVRQLHSDFNPIALKKQKEAGETVDSDILALAETIINLNNTIQQTIDEFASKKRAELVKNGGALVLMLSCLILILLKCLILIS